MRNKLEKIIYVNWEESERRYGTRPDGCSLHLTKGDFEVYVNAYWDKQPKEIPDAYSRPAVRPVNAYASPKLYKKIQKSDNGLRFLRHQETELVTKQQLVYGKERIGWVGKKQNSH